MDKKLKIAYISLASLSDCDLPLIHELSKDMKVDYYLIATNATRQGAVVSIELKNEGGIFSGTEYPELRSIEQWIYLNNVYIVNKPVWQDWKWLSFKVSWQLMKILKKRGYDIIHVTWPLRYSTFPLYFLHKKMLLTMHDPIPHSSDENMQNKLHRWCSIHLTHDFILLNKTQKKDFMERYHVSEDRVHISRLSIYTHLQHIVPAKPLCDKPYILFMGSIQPHKGIEYFCQAMESVVREKPDIHAVIAGKGHFYFDKTKYEENPSFTFINRFITNEELASLISNCVAVVCPYIDATQSGVVMSAFALNKPVIATTVGALPKMMEDNRHGFLVPPKNSQALERAIVRILQPEIAQQMSRNIEQDFSSGDRSWGRIAKELYQIYQTVIEKQNKI
jgi:glycosyltransferase involved in cell wall biosynthesis